jgi:hypothetical protein
MNNKIPAQPGLLNAYIKLGVTILIGTIVVVLVYLLTINNNANNPNGNKIPSFCICPNCGLTIPKTTGLDCEEVNCPNCGHLMSKSIMLAANNTPAPQNRLQPLTQNRRETLAERGVITPGPLNQNQRETLLEQGALPHRISPPINTIPPVSPVVQQNVLSTKSCVCPRCGTRSMGYPGISCANTNCPVCRSPMTNAIVVGGGQPGNNVSSKPVLAGLPAPCPQARGGMHHHIGTNHIQTNNNPTGYSYSNTIKDIIQKNCLRCHGGPIRNLSTYTHVKAYVDNGLLMMMIQPGGPMSRFLSADESHQIASWIKAGAPQ